jgi:hypothetical protein
MLIKIIFLILILIFDLSSQEIRSGNFISEKTNLKNTPSGFSLGVTSSLSASHLYSKGELHSIDKNPASLVLFQEFNPSLKNSPGSLQRDSILYENIENYTFIQSSNQKPPSLNRFHVSYLSKIRLGFLSLVLELNMKMV